MRRRTPAIAIGLVVCVAAGIALLSNVLASNSLRTLDEPEVKQLLRQLPYRFQFKSVRVPKDASGAVAGAAIGKHRTVVHFGVSLEEGYHPVRLPKPAVLEATGGQTFLVSSDITIWSDDGIARGRQFRTQAQWNEAASIVTAIEGKLCRATTGEPCPI